MVPGKKEKKKKKKSSKTRCTPCQRLVSRGGGKTGKVGVRRSHEIEVADCV